MSVTCLFFISGSVRLDLVNLQAGMMPSEYEVVDANIFVRFALFTVAI